MLRQDNNYLESKSQENQNADTCERLDCCATGIENVVMEVGNNKFITFWICEKRAQKIEVKIILFDTSKESKIDRMLKEIAFTDHLQTELDHGNENVLENFKLGLVMEVTNQKEDLS